MPVVEMTALTIDAALDRFAALITRARRARTQKMRREHKSKRKEIKK